MAIADVDGDRRADAVLVTGFGFDADNDYSVFVFLQDADGALRAPVRYPYGATSNAGIGLAVGDLDGDGTAEIVVGHDAGATIMRWDRSVTPAVMRVGRVASPQGLQALAIADVNRDGWADIVGVGGEALRVLAGDGAGQAVPVAYRSMPGRMRSDLKAADMDGDGFDDIVVQSEYPDARPVLFRNDGSDTMAVPVFLGTDTQIAAAALVLLDLGGDRRNDVIAARGTGELAIYRQSFKRVLLPAGTLNVANVGALQAADLDGDGRSDLVVRGRDQNVRIYLQRRTGLEFFGSYAGPIDSTFVSNQGLAIGDLDGDGCPDVAVASSGQGLAVFKSRSCAAFELEPRITLRPALASLLIPNDLATPVSNVTLDIALGVTQGTVSLGATPPGCSAAPQGPQYIVLSCAIGDIGPAQSRSIEMPLQVSANDPKARLWMHATAGATVGSERRRGSRVEEQVFIHSRTP